MSTPSSKRTPANSSAGMRMAELSARSGVARETIHYYLREGLLPRPRKGGRTVAYYDEEHLERLRLIRRLREEKYLPLAVIRRMLDSHTASAERDVETLVEVLHLDSSTNWTDGRGAASAEARTEATRRGLLGASREGASGGEPGTDLAEARVLSVVDEVLALEPDARDFTLADLERCSRDIAALVDAEAELFFDTVLQKADIMGTVHALRAGRGAVARYITAYRDLMLQRIVEELLLAVQQAPMVVASWATVSVSAKLEKELGVSARRAELREAALRGVDPTAAATALTWHLFGCHAVSELAELPREIVEAADPEAAALVAWGIYETTRGQGQLAELEKAVEAAGDFALGQILVVEAHMSHGVLRREEGTSFLESAVPALHQLVRADVDAQPTLRARAHALFHRGRIELLLPRVLGRRDRGVASLTRALELVESAAPGELEPAPRARLRINIRLALGRHHSTTGRADLARQLFEEAMNEDPGGPIAEVVLEHLAARPGMATG